MLPLQRYGDAVSILDLRSVERTTGAADLLAAELLAMAERRALPSESAKAAGP